MSLEDNPPLLACIVHTFLCRTGSCPLLILIDLDLASHCESKEKSAMWKAILDMTSLPQTQFLAFSTTQGTQWVRASLGSLFSERVGVTSKEEIESRVSSSAYTLGVTASTTEKLVVKLMRRNCVNIAQCRGCGDAIHLFSAMSSSESQRKSVADSFSPISPNISAQNASPASSPVISSGFLSLIPRICEGLVTSDIATAPTPKRLHMPVLHVVAAAPRGHIEQQPLQLRAVLAPQRAGVDPEPAGCRTTPQQYTVGAPNLYDYGGYYANAQNGHYGTAAANAYPYGNVYTAHQAYGATGYVYPTYYYNAQQPPPFVAQPQPQPQAPPPPPPPPPPPHTGAGPAAANLAPQHQHHPQLQSQAPRPPAYVPPPPGTLAPPVSSRPTAPVTPMRPAPLPPTPHIPNGTQRHQQQQPPHTKANNNNNNTMAAPLRVVGGGPQRTELHPANTTATNASTTTTTAAATTGSGSNTGTMASALLNANTASHIQKVSRPNVPPSAIPSSTTTATANANANANTNPNANANPNRRGGGVNLNGSSRPAVRHVAVAIKNGLAPPEPPVMFWKSTGDTTPCVVKVEPGLENEKPKNARGTTELSHAAQTGHESHSQDTQMLAVPAATQSTMAGPASQKPPRPLPSQSLNQQKPSEETHPTSHNAPPVAPSQNIPQQTPVNIVRPSSPGVASVSPSQYSKGQTEDNQKPGAIPQMKEIQQKSQEIGPPPPVLHTLRLNSPSIQLPIPPQVTLGAIQHEPNIAHTPIKSKGQSPPRDAIDAHTPNTSSQASAIPAVHQQPEFDLSRRPAQTTESISHATSIPRSPTTHITTPESAAKFHGVPHQQAQQSVLKYLPQNQSSQQYVNSTSATIREKERDSAREILVQYAHFRNKAEKAIEPTKKVSHKRHPEEPLRAKRSLYDLGKGLLQSPGTKSLFFSPMPPCPPPLGPGDVAQQITPAEINNRSVLFACKICKALGSPKEGTWIDEIFFCSPRCAAIHIPRMWFYITERIEVRQIPQCQQFLNTHYFSSPTIKEVSASLHCPVSHSSINIPVRGKFCTHFQCFDLRRFMRKNQCNFRSQWLCPVCNKPCYASQLTVDLLFFHLLQRSEGRYRCAHVFRDWKFEVTDFNAQPVMDNITGKDIELSDPLPSFSLEEEEGTVVLRIETDSTKQNPPTTPTHHPLPTQIIPQAIPRVEAQATFQHPTTTRTPTVPHSITIIPVANHPRKSSHVTDNQRNALVDATHATQPHPNNNASNTPKSNGDTTANIHPTTSNGPTAVTVVSITAPTTATATETTTTTTNITNTTVTTNINSQANNIGTNTTNTENNSAPRPATPINIPGITASPFKLVLSQVHKKVITLNSPRHQNQQPQSQTPATNTDGFIPMQPGPVLPLATFDDPIVVDDESESQQYPCVYDELYH
ncbi:hypothetical protein Pelo_12038 [Pelomyxa schiedti]|nr:hypothetical protein Pelo_12038 [Pelomyxa schiedti]